MSSTSIPTDQTYTYTRLVLTPFLLLLLYTVSLALFRIYFHPLAKHPGPFLAKLTDLHSTYHAWKGDRHLHFHRCHERYGPVVRYGPNSLSLNTSTALREIYGYKANVRKSDFYTAFPPKKRAFSTHSCIDKRDHARKRRVLSHAFSDTAVKSMEEHILSHVRLFCANLGKRTPSPDAAVSEKVHQDAQQWSPAKNISDEANHLTFDIMGDLCFGKAFDMLSSPANRFAADLISSAARRHLICGSYLPLHEYHLDTVLFRKIARQRQQYVQYGKAQAVERTKLGEGAGRKDFFYYLLSARDPETGLGFSEGELWAETNLLIVAGSDTTSTALAAAFFYLVHNPGTLQKLAKEVRAAFSAVEDIRVGRAMSGCQYLRACIDEAMRLSPSVGGILPRQVLPGGIEIDGVHVADGTVVGVPIYAIHHNEAYFSEPFAYKPERWIVGSAPDTGATAESLALAQSAFCPFSVGPRGCIGKSMAYSEMSISLARAVWLYDFRLAPGTVLGEGRPEWAYGRHRSGEYQLWDTFTSWKDGPLLEFRLRAQ